MSGCSPAAAPPSKAAGRQGRMGGESRRGGSAQRSLHLQPPRVIMTHTHTQQPSSGTPLAPQRPPPHAGHPCLHCMPLQLTRRFLWLHLPLAGVALAAPRCRLVRSRRLISCRAGPHRHHLQLWIVRLIRNWAQSSGMGAGGTCVKQQRRQGQQRASSQQGSRGAVVLSAAQTRSTARSHLSKRQQQRPQQRHPPCRCGGAGPQQGWWPPLHGDKRRGWPVQRGPGGLGGKRRRQAQRGQGGRS